MVVSAQLEVQRCARVLLVEDAGPMRTALAQALQRLGYEIETAGSESEVVDALTTWRPALVLLDLSVNDGLALSICRRVHETSGVPVILIASPNSEELVLTALEIGATYYVVRPLDIEMVALQIDVAIESNDRIAPRDAGQPFVTGPLTIRTASRTIAVRGQEMSFSRREYDLTLSLAVQPGHIRTFDELLDEIWGHRPPTRDTLYTHIRRIRQKVELDEHHPRHVITVRRFGFYFEPGDPSTW